QPAGDRAVGAGGHEQVEDLERVEEGDLVPDALLVERVQDRVAGPIRGETAAAYRALAVVAGVAAEPPLVDQSFRRAVEGHAQVLEVDDRLNRVVAHNLRGVLDDEVVAALDRV